MKNLVKFYLFFLLFSLALEKSSSEVGRRPAVENVSTIELNHEKQNKKGHDQIGFDFMENSLTVKEKEKFQEKRIMASEKKQQGQTPYLRNLFIIIFMSFVPLIGSYYFLKYSKK